MAEFLIYDLKVAVLIAVFYFCYRLLMERETMHRLNRIVLLSSILFSLALPLCVVTLHKTIEVEQMQTTERPGMVITDLGASTEVAVQTVPEKNWMDTIKNFLQPSVIFAIFIIGLVCRLLYIANSYRYLRRMIKDSEQYPLEDGVTLAVVDLPVAPFSWMRTIVLSRIDYEERNPSILAHERGHILLHHSWDIVFVEVLTALQWFNPVVWLLRRDLRTIHEYEADASVLSSGSDVSQYIQLLMRKATGTKACILANGINNSTTKKRINMMLVNKSPHRNSLKLLALLPIIGITLALNAETITDVVYKNDEPLEQVTINMVGTWLDSGTEDDLKELMDEGKFYATGYYFGADGWLRIAEYEGLLLEMTKKEKRYQYKFSDKFLTLTADGKTENILYELNYNSMAGKFLILHWKGEKITLIKPDNAALQMLQDFDKMSTSK